MMSSNHDQLMRLLYFAGCGVLLGAYYEGFSLWRHLCRPAKMQRFLADVFFCITGGVVVFAYSLAVQNGVWDVWMFVGLVLGATVWRQTAGQLTRPIGTILQRSHRLCRRLYRRCDENCRKTLKKVVIFLKKGLRVCRRLVYNQE